LHSFLEVGKTQDLPSKFWQTLGDALTVEQVHKGVTRILKSQIEVGESSKSKPRVTSRILLNKWQRQQEKERYQKQKYEEEK
jgi:hypothetical protein